MNTISFGAAAERKTLGSLIPGTMFRLPKGTTHYMKSGETGGYINLHSGSYFRHDYVARGDLDVIPLREGDTITITQGD